jgi:CRP/FNR family cyclic AMP-dependent transcriptional regulator
MSGRKWRCREWPNSRAACNILESEAQSTHEVQHEGPSQDFIRFGRTIQRGRVKLSVTSKADKESIVAILGPGEFLGETCLGSQNIRMRTATAIAPTALQVIRRNEMIRALHADHALSYRFLSYLISRNIRLEEDLVDQVSHCCERRLARALLLLAGKGDRRKLHSFAGISQGALASMIGTTRSRVSFFMNKFKTVGFIKYRGRLDAHGGIQINTTRLAKALLK